MWTFLIHGCRSPVKVTSSGLIQVLRISSLIMVGERPSEVFPSSITSTCLGICCLNDARCQQVPGWTPQGAPGLSSACRSPTGQVADWRALASLYLTHWGRPRLPPTTASEINNPALEREQSCHSTESHSGKVKKGIFGLTVNSQVLQKNESAAVQREKGSIYFFLFSCRRERSTEDYFDDRN